MVAMVDGTAKWWRWWTASPNGADGDDRPQMVAMVDGLTKWCRWWFQVGR